LVEVSITLRRSFTSSITGKSNDDHDENGDSSSDDSSSDEDSGDHKNGRRSAATSSDSLVACPEWPVSDEHVKPLGALLQLLQPSYGATLGAEDRACLRLLLLLDGLIASHWVGRVIYRSGSHSYKCHPTTVIPAVLSPVPTCCCHTACLQSNCLSTKGHKYLKMPLCALLTHAHSIVNLLPL
jgi:hypothetical protein